MQTAVRLEEPRKEAKPPFTYNEFFKRHGPELIGAARKAGVPHEDALDILQDTLVEFITRDDLPGESELSARVLTKKVKPALFGAFAESVLKYWDVSQTEIPTGAITIDERLKNFLQINIGQRILEHLYKGTEPTDGDVHETPTYRKTRDFRRDTSFTQVYEFCRTEIFDALLLLGPRNIADLKERYTFTPKQRQFDRLAKSPPHCLERRLAEFVAYGAVDMSTNDLLANPIFYQALSYALEMIDVDPNESSYDQPRFLPRRAIKAGSSKNNRAKTANNKNKEARLKRYAIEWGLGKRWASRVVDYFRRHSVGVVDATRMIRNISFNPLYEDTFKKVYKLEMKQRKS